MAGRSSGVGTPVGVSGRRVPAPGLVLAALLLCALGLVGPVTLRAAATASVHGHGAHVVKAVAAASPAPVSTTRPDTPAAVPGTSAAPRPAAAAAGTATSSPISSSVTAETPRPRGPPSDAS